MLASQLVGCCCLPRGLCEVAGSQCGANTLAEPFGPQCPPPHPEKQQPNLVVPIQVLDLAAGQTRRLAGLSLSISFARKPLDLGMD